MSDYESLARLSRDLKQASATMGPAEARYLVDAYYIMQEDRKRSRNQVRALDESAEPHAVLVWLADNSRRMEAWIKGALDVYSDANPVGRWSKSVVGIGPVIAAGLLAHIDIERAPTVGHIWSFAGLDPKAEWKKGKKRPWNAQLKTLSWKIGESFVKVSGKEDAVYGHVYAERKALETQKNERGDYRDQAAAKLAKFKIGKNTEAHGHYSAGRLPPAHVHARAKRYAVKLFLAHWHEVAYRERYGKAPPLPYPIAHLGHAHVISA